MTPATDYEVIVLGGGKGGKTLATELGHKGIKTALIERSADMIGGSCINVACIPSKTLIASARVAEAARQAGNFGVRTGEVTVDWPAVRRRAEGVVSAMRAMKHKNFTSAPSLKFILGTGRFIGPRLIEVRETGGRICQLTSEKIFVNTGTRPALPKIPGLDEVPVLNSETIQRVDVLPRHLVIIGGSYVALEFAQMFRRFGSEVTVLERGPQLLRHEDADVAEALSKLLRDDGIDIQLNCAVERIEKGGEGVGIALTEEARQQGLEIRVAKFPVASIPRAKTMSETRGFIKAVIDAKTHRILGCAIFSMAAGEMLGTVQIAMIGGLPFTALRDAVLAHPTLVEGFNNLFVGLGS